MPRLHVLLCPVGSTGDLNPMLGIGGELRRRGHEVTLLGTESHGEPTAATGLEFVAVQDRETERAALEHADAWSYGNGRRRHIPVRCLEPLRRTYDAIAARHRSGRTVLVATNWCLAARVAQERLSLPAATVHHNAFTLRGARGAVRMPPPMLVGSWVPRSWIAWQYWIADKFFLDPLITPQLNAFRRELGLAPVGRVMHGWWNSPDAVIGLFPDWWAGPQADWPQQGTLVGFPQFDRNESTSLDESTSRFLEQGDPPIVFSPGESNLHTVSYFAAAAEACRRLNRRGLIITSRLDRLPTPLPAHLHACRYAPFSTILNQAAAVVHQAGIGTVAACLRAGVPQVCVPTIFNQPDTAERLRRLGVARTIPPQRFSADRLTHALGELLGGPDVHRRCTELAARLESSPDAIHRAADIVESLIPA